MSSKTYRAKRKNWRELPKEQWWVEGAVFEGKENSYIITNVKVTDEWEDSEIGADVIGYLVDAETICQDTKMTDKNGRKIFEWDIIKEFADCNDFGESNYYLYQIRWDKECCAFEGYNIRAKETFLFPDLGEIEIIGNIFDNPELIKEETV